jgi:hypothetical protein
MPTKAIVHADLQASEGAERLRANPAIPLQRWRVERLYADLATLMKEHGCRYLIDLGDTTDDRHAVPVPTLEAVFRGLATCHPRPLLSIKLIGNHEQALRANHLHPGGAYRTYHRVVADREVIIRGDVATVAVAWPNNPTEISEWLDRTLRSLRDRGYRTLLLGHLQIHGVKVNGLEWPGEHLFDPELVDLALLGHIHSPQSPHPNIHYVGSPFQQNYGESGQTKRVGMLDMDTLEIQWLALPSDYPRYLRLTMPELGTQQDLGEDRATITLRTVQEAEAFHHHPLAPLVEPDYALTPETPTLVEGDAPELGANPKELLEAYVCRNPLPGVESADLLSTGYNLLGV